MSEQPAAIPRSIRDLVQASGEGFAITLPRHDATSMVVTGVGSATAALVAGLVSFLAMLTLVLEVLQLPPHMSQLAALGVGLSVGFFVFAIPLAIVAFLGTAERLTLDARQASFSAIYRVTRSAGPVHVEGRPGQNTTIRVGGQLLWVFRPEDAAAGWDSTAISWFVDTLARMWDQPLDDQRDRAALRAFETDPDERARLEWLEELRANQDAYPGFHALEAVAPEHTADLDGLTLPLFERRTRPNPVRVTRDALELKGATIPLVDIDGVRVTFGEQELEADAPSWHVTLAVRLGRELRVVSLASIDTDAEQRIGWHLWARDRIEEAVARARSEVPAEIGDADDVPAALRRMQAAERRRAGD